MKLASIGFLLFIFTIGLWSCGSKKDNSDSVDSTDVAQDKTLQEISEILDNLPSPTEVPYLIMQSGAEFNQGLINDRNKVDSYLSRNDKSALALGVFISDIGYLVSFEKTQDAINYVTTSKKLAEGLGVLGTFDQKMLKQFESNIGNKDSLGNLVKSAVTQTKDYLKGDNRVKPAILMFTGSFVEGLFISTGLIKTYPKDLLDKDERTLILTPMLNVVLNQRKSVGDLIKLLGFVEQTEPVVSILADLNTLDASYRALNIEEKIKNDQASKVFTDKNFSDIIATVEKLRKSIVE